MRRILKCKLGFGILSLTLLVAGAAQAGPFDRRPTLDGEIDTFHTREDFSGTPTYRDVPFFAGISPFSGANAPGEWETADAICRLAQFTKANSYSARSAFPDGQKSATGSAKIILLNVASIETRTRMNDGLEVFDTEKRPIRVFTSIQCIRVTPPASDCAKETR